MSTYKVGDCVYIFPTAFYLADSAFGVTPIKATVQRVRFDELYEVLSDHGIPWTVSEREMLPVEDKPDEAFIDWTSAIIFVGGFAAIMLGLYGAVHG